MFKHSDILDKLKAAQNVQRDMRDAAREAELFLHKRDGQWEPEIVSRMSGKPRYTDDRVNPIINQIAGELENAEFTIRVRPAGGDATVQLSNLYDGVIRNIRNLSNADSIMAQAGRKMAGVGFSAWLIEHDYYDSDSFDQDLLIRPIHDAHDRVWLDPNDLSDDGSDAKWGVILHFIGKEEYEKQFPKGKMKSLGTHNYNQAYYYKPDHITIGHLYYCDESPEILYKMTDGRILKSSETPDEELEALLMQGIDIDETRETKSKTCKFRMFDAGGYLSGAEDTVFDSIPIIPVYGNFTVAEGKAIYHGATEKLMDMQRVHNYAISRYVEEVALSPRKKIFMTTEQAEGFEESIRTMNTNMNPVQFYNNDGVSPPPFEVGAPNVNQAVQILVEQSDQAINRSAGMFAANMGENTHLQSGVAIDKQIDRGNNGTSVYFESMERAIVRTGRILVKAIPKVYDATRQLRLLKEDGSMEMAIINQVVMGQDGQPMMVNDLSAGKYDVVCDIGAAYKNRQQESSEMFMRAMERDPTLLQTAGDIWVKNIDAIGFDKIAERLRAIALNNGVIPMEQMTEEEKELMQQKAQEPKQPSAEEMAMQVSMMQAQTQQMREQNIGQQHQIKMMEIQAKFANDQEKTQSKLAVDGAKIDQSQQKIDNDVANQLREFALKLTELEAKYMTDLNNEVKQNVLTYDPKTGKFK